MNAPLYTTEILRLAAALAAPVKLEREDGSAELRSPTCGSRVATSVQVDADGRVQALTQQVHACAFGQASAAILQQEAVGRGAEDIKQAVTALEAWLGGACETPHWPGIAALAPALPRIARHGAILLPFKSLAAALAGAANRYPLEDSPPAP